MKIFLYCLRHSLQVSDMYDGDNNGWINNNGNENEWTIGYRLGRGQEGAFNNFCVFGPAQICHNDEDLNDEGKKVRIGIYFSPESRWMEKYTGFNSCPIRLCRILIKQI